MRRIQKMTFEEKVDMWSEKKRFIDAINGVFQTKPAGSTIEKIEYEVYQKEIGGKVRYEEWLILYFEGGAMLATLSTGSSNIANLRTIASYLSGGYYEEVRTYRALLETGWEPVVLES
jgi:hypothetical protein